MSKYSNKIAGGIDKNNNQLTLFSYKSPKFSSQALIPSSDFIYGVFHRTIRVFNLSRVLQLMDCISDLQKNPHHVSGFDVVYDNENVVRNDPNGEFINLRDENDDLDDETKFHDELESESDDENENEEAYCKSGSE
ncbi:hypothetical protein H5410_057447 [Solanum commersonii]|uniref:Uncharacterized protein n=1 Tax=Solanum commersonii TaxID=4109 RepID=A0A9J5WN31_SOLCO|nr:hypothetical protein H5410_057447 [Solanum commersonii]